MSRTYGGNFRKVLTLIGVEDEYSRDVAATMHLSGLTHSPMSAGAQGASNQGLADGGSSLTFETLVPPIQDFIGAASPAVPTSRRTFGDDLAGSLPNTGAGGGASSVAWLDLGKTGTGLRGL